MLGSRTGCSETSLFGSSPDSLGSQLVLFGIMRCPQSLLGTRSNMSDFSDLVVNRMRRQFHNRKPLIYSSILTALIVAFSIELFAFARVQDIWVDESTQLSGITLKLWDMLRWLSGVDATRFGVPGDRMPPVSYLLDWLWLGLSGPSELGFRLFHSTFVIAGAAVLAVVALRGAGLLAATVTVVFITLSPKLIQTGVEIRAYPIFFAITCVQVAIFLKLLVDPIKVDRKLLAIFVLVCLIGIYTHFYGVISSIAFFFALGSAFIRSPRSLLALVVALAIVILGSWGLLPFLLSALSQSPPTTAHGIPTTEYFAYLLRLIAGPANMISMFGSVLFFGGALTLLLAGMIAAFVRSRNARVQPFDWLFLIVLAGAFAPIAATLVIRNFNVLNAPYSGWLIAPLALLIGCATSSTGFRPWDQGGRIVAVCAMLIGAAVSTYIFLINASMFIHGPQRFVGALYDESAGPKAIVYDVGSVWGFSYFPLIFSHNGKIIQYRVVDNGAGLIRIGNDASQSIVQNVKSAVAPYNRLVVVDLQLRTFRDLRECYNQSNSCPQFTHSAIEEMLIGTGQWRETGAKRSFGLYDTEVKVLERVTGRAMPK